RRESPPTTGPGAATRSAPPCGRRWNSPKTGFRPASWCRRRASAPAGYGRAASRPRPAAAPRGSWRRKRRCRAAPTPSAAGPRRGSARTAAAGNSNPAGRRGTAGPARWRPAAATPSAPQRTTCGSCGGGRGGSGGLGLGLGFDFGFGLGLGFGALGAAGAAGMAGLGGGLGFGSGTVAALHQVALAIGLEVGFIPAAALEAEAGSRNLLGQRLGLALRASSGGRVGNLLQEFRGGAAVGADVFVKRHGDLRCPVYPLFVRKPEEFKNLRAAFRASAPFQRDGASRNRVPLWSSVRSTLPSSICHKPTGQPWGCWFSA